jgi:hypothetical protein
LAVSTTVCTGVHRKQPAPLLFTRTSAMVIPAQTLNRITTIGFGQFDLSNLKTDLLQPLQKQRFLAVEQARNLYLLPLEKYYGN